MVTPQVQGVHFRTGTALNANLSRERKHMPATQLGPPFPPPLHLTHTSLGHSLLHHHHPAAAPLPRDAARWLLDAGMAFGRTVTTADMGPLRRLQETRLKRVFESGGCA